MLKSTSRIVDGLRGRLVEELTYLLEDLKRLEYSVSRIRNLLDRKLEKLVEAVRDKEE